ncbi:uncharacterized protein CLUP02_10058 [Colletotrichum lupini]|uniref:Uncharacterized protein n=1 Tax=Colletotrichum lupini TaxID=145971 RepID=A0A9Q8WII8_9PEZI|nr:uncharacterized protein CLUP02_10058 [Colletotrichum lupini]UQC84561.1 hypothetical protein CLUP02_10058 [Colletotrichum lupini]
MDTITGSFALFRLRSNAGVGQNLPALLLFVVTFHLARTIYCVVPEVTRGEQGRQSHLKPGSTRALGRRSSNPVFSRRAERYFDVFFGFSRRCYASQRRGGGAIWDDATRNHLIKKQSPTTPVSQRRLLDTSKNSSFVTLSQAIVLRPYCK